MAEFCSSVFAKHSGNTLSPIFFCAIFFGLVSILAANNICTQYKHITLKPTNTYAKCGLTIPVKAARSAPTVAYSITQNNGDFNLTTIVMLSPKGQNSVHWLRTDIPIDRLALGTAKGSDDIYPYKEPNPAKGTGVFSYEIYLLSQPIGGNVSVSPYIDSYRKNFKLMEFKKANAMEVLGVFQYFTEYDKSGSGRSSISVILGIIYVVLAVFIGA